MSELENYEVSDFRIDVEWRGTPESKVSYNWVPDMPTNTQKLHA